MHIRRFQRSAHRSRGIVLPVVLIMLLVLTIASLVVVGQISSQTRMAANAAVNQISLQAAEALLRNVSSQLVAGGISNTLGSYQPDADTPNTNGLYQYNALIYPTGKLLPWNNPLDWAAANNYAIPPAEALCANPGVTSTGGLVITDCRYIVERLPSVLPPGGSTVNVYRITARVIGQSGQGTVMLQTLFQMPQ